MKNYYAILGVSRDAVPEEIKRAFRDAAKKHHPDKAPDNPFADAHFKELQEAYEVLSHPAKRSRYDEECWLRGLYQRKGRFTISPQWILGEATKLRRHIEQVDVYRMNHLALKDYVVALLSDEHLSILREAPELHELILDQLIPSLRHISIRYAQEAGKRLLLLAGNDVVLQKSVHDWMTERRREAFWNRYRPLFVLLAVLAICLLIWEAQH